MSDDLRQPGRVDLRNVNLAGVPIPSYPVVDAVAIGDDGVTVLGVDGDSLTGELAEGAYMIAFRPVAD